MHKQLILIHYLGLTLEDFTYQRRDNIIRVPLVYENLEQYNYVMYQNPDYSTKWYYAYITDLRYINDNMTEVTIKTDVFQTWQFDFIYMKSFVEREMVNNDTAGLHTIPEGLETGEYKINSSEYFDDLDECLYMVQTTEWVSGADNPLATNYGGIYMAGGAYTCETYQEVVSIIQALITEKGSAVYNVYMIPKAIVNQDPVTMQYPRTI